MSGEGIVRRCVECDFLLFDGEPYVLTDYGYAHPTCAPEETT